MMPSASIARLASYRWTLAGIKARWHRVRGRTGLVVALRLAVDGPNPLRPTDDWRKASVAVDDVRVLVVGGLIARKARSRFLQLPASEVQVVGSGAKSSCQVSVSVSQGLVAVVEVFGAAEDRRGATIPAFCLVNGSQA